MPFFRRHYRGPLSRRLLRRPLAAPLLFGMLFLSLLLVAGCGSGGGSNGNQPPNGTGKLVSQPGWNIYTNTYALSPKKWTFLVYLNAANNLEPDGDLNVNQMESIGSTNDVNIVVQWKRIGGRYNPSGGTWSNTRRYYITKDSNLGSVGSPLISDNSSLDMGDPNSLQAFVQWGVAAYPAQHYCLVLWDHGAGWRAQTLSRAATASAGPRRGISYDDLTGNHIDTTQLAAAMDISSAGLKWDLVTIDCSLMQMMEVAYEIRNQESYILGSEESPPGTGLPYDTLLSNLTSNPDMTPLSFGTVIAQDTLADYGSTSDTTQSVIDTSKLPALATAIDNLGTALYSAKSQWGTQISAARANTEHYSLGEEAATGYLYIDYKDLIDFTSKLQAQPSAPYISAAQAVQSAAAAAIVYNANGSGHPNSHGLSIFLPTPTDYAKVNADQLNGNGLSTVIYTDLAFAKASPNWVNFLQNGPN